MNIRKNNEIDFSWMTQRNQKQDHLDLLHAVLNDHFGKDRYRLMKHPRLYPHLKNDDHIPGNKHYFIWDACSFAMSKDLHKIVMKNIESIRARNKIAKLTEDYLTKIKELGKTALLSGESIHRLQIEIKSSQPSLFGTQYLEPKAVPVPNQGFVNADKVSAVIVFFFFYGIFDVQTSRNRFAPAKYTQVIDVMLEYATRYCERRESLNFPKWTKFSKPEISRFLSEMGLDIAKAVPDEWIIPYPVLEAGLKRFLTRKAPEGKARPRKNSRY